MPRNDQLIRQWQLLRLLESPRGVTLNEIARRLPPDYPRHIRTIRRDLEALEAEGFPSQHLTPMKSSEISHFKAKQSHDMPVPQEQIEQAIHTIRGHRIMLDHDLAKLYGVSTKSLNQAVKRNANRFPQDFAFRLTAAEARSLRAPVETSRLEPLKHRDTMNRSQTVTGSQKHRDPRAFLARLATLATFDFVDSRPFFQPHGRQKSRVRTRKMTALDPKPHRPSTPEFQPIALPR